MTDVSRRRFMSMMGAGGAGLTIAPLLAMQNVVLLPHLGSASRETRVAMGLRVLANLDAFFAGREPPDRVA